MMFTALNCPQCSAPLPRVALWRPVNCASCGALITRGASLVHRDAFRKALQRARDAADAERTFECGGSGYRTLTALGSGNNSSVHLALRVGSHPLLATVKLGTTQEAANRFQREAQAIRELQATEAGGQGAFFSRLLPEVVALAASNPDRPPILMLRHPVGYWGSLAALAMRFPGTLDPRHTVWIWRRMLALLGFIHDQGWIHGSVCPEHAIVHPHEHGIRFVGWGDARGGATRSEQGDELVRSARVILVLLSGPTGEPAVDTPRSLLELVRRASDDAAFCQRLGARGLDESLRSEARTAFGPPTFVRLTP